MKTTLDEQRRIVAYLDGLPPALRFGDLRQAKVDAVRGPHKGGDIAVAKSRRIVCFAAVRAATAGRGV